MRNRFDRRRFLGHAAATVLGLALPGVVGCRSRGERNTRSASRQGRFPLLEVRGTPRQVGLAIGKRFGEQIREGLKRRKDWFDELRRFVESDPASHYDPFLSAGQRFFPEVVEELRGWSEGSGVAFRDLMVLNLKAELSAMMRGAREESPGCSTLACSHAGRSLLAHNEDGHRAYRDLMFLVRVSQPGKPNFLCLTYPGILSGNGPAANEAGIVLTTNFIAGLRVKPGVPRYFLSRAVLNSRTLKEAVETVTHPERAFAFHYNLASRDEGRILSVETTEEHHATREIDGLYVHTNHLLLPGMSETPQDLSYVNVSSMSRYRVLESRAAPLRSRPDAVDETTLVKMLSTHENAPYSPCRHATNEVSGATLGCAVFDSRREGLRLFFSNPCRGQDTRYSVEHG